MECQGDGFHWLLWCSGALINGLWYGIVWLVWVLGVSMGHWVCLVAMGLYRAIVGLYGLVKWMLGYDNTSKHIYLACFRLVIE